MKFNGVLVKESLQDERVLEGLAVTRTEKWDVQHAAEFQPRAWTAIYFEGDAAQADAVAERLSRALKPCWYADFATEGEQGAVYVVFPNRVFKYARGDRRKRSEAVKYGEWLGIPKAQLDWGE